ncbi:MAG: 30S ribosomal protein S12 methylthiotransferase RimO [Clostridiales bacterium]|nr:30S ribosomal protein S12 methylthiotransferase RimO [Clostridia bacterium]MCR4882682.1 30S ribosomal protein S12 methylthiotransferase RimO [Clostridiales bacterium]
MLKVGLDFFGCNKNLVDAEIALGLMRDHGYVITSDLPEADIIIVNTCAFINPAKTESIDGIFEMAQYKQTGKCRLLVVTGCLAQRYASALMADIPEIDILLGVNQYDKLPEAVEHVLQTGERYMSIKDPHVFFEHQRVLSTPDYSAYIRIGEGCSNHCTFCAIPLIRGNYRSRNEDAILKEVRSFAEAGVKEHVLVAQDTTRYGTETHAHSTLPSLMRKCADIPGVEWLRVLYCYPDETSEELLDLMVERDNVCRYLDLPIQHINNDILKRMHRRGDASDIRRCVRLARERNITLRTSIIVGFPGETEEQFEELLDFLGEAQFDRLGAFAYSPEEDTPAARMPNQIDEDIKQERLDRLMRRQAEISLARNRARLGETVKTLILGKNQDGVYEGRSEREAPETDGVLLIDTDKELQRGQFVSVRLTEADYYDIRGVQV